MTSLPAAENDVRPGAPAPWTAAGAGRGRPRTSVHGPRRRSPGGADDPVREAYRVCHRIQRRHDPTLFLATARLPSDIRPATRALYAYVRVADQIVDGPARPSGRSDRGATLDAWERALWDGVAGEPVEHPVVLALVDAHRRHGLALHEIGPYMASMRIDLDPVRIRSTQELDRYMDGSTGTVGRMMAPLLALPSEHHEGLGRLGPAFQLTNFLRDVREDVALDRVYIPATELERHDVGERELRGDVSCPGLRAVILEQTARARDMFAAAEPAIRAAPSTARRGIRLACSVYLRVLDRIEEIDGDVLGERTVPRPWSMALAALRGARG